MIDTTVPVVHDCQCTIWFPGHRENKPTAHGFYRGFIWHRWLNLGYCLLPVELPVKEAGWLMAREQYAQHALGSGEKTACIWPVRGPRHVKKLVDRFWEKLMTREEVPSE